VDEGGEICKCSTTVKRDRERNSWY